MGRQDREQTRAVEARQAWGDLFVAMRRGDSAWCARLADPAHRETDWRLPATDDQPAGPWTCGICHPPAVEDIEPRQAVPSA